jgi:hypothetical protein
VQSSASLHESILGCILGISRITQNRKRQPVDWRAILNQHGLHDNRIIDPMVADETIYITSDHDHFIIWTYAVRRRIVENMDVGRAYARPNTTTILVTA